MDIFIRKTLRETFPQFSTPSKSRFLEVFKNLPQNYSSLEVNYDFQSYDIDIQNILSGKDRRTSVIIKGFPSAMKIQEVYYVLNSFCKDIDFFYIPTFIKEKKKYMFSFANVSNYLALIELCNGVYKLKYKKTFYCGYDFSELEIYYSKAQGINNLSKKCFGERES